MIRNIVRGVNPAGQIWVISDFRADVKVDGRIRVDGRGLLLGGGNTIGTNGNASVFATLICEATPPFTQFSTNITGVPLAANGDFRIDDMLMPAPPAECGSPVLLMCVAQRSLVCCGHPEARLAPMEQGHIKGLRFCRRWTTCGHCSLAMMPSRTTVRTTNSSLQRARTVIQTACLE